MCKLQHRNTRNLKRQGNIIPLKNCFPENEFKDSEINKILGKGFKGFLVELIGDLKEDTNRQVISIRDGTQSAAQRKPQQSGWENSHMEEGIYIERQIQHGK